MSRLVPPEAVRGMTSLKRDKFRLEISLPIMTINRNNLEKLLCLPIIRNSLVKNIHHFKPIQDEPDSNALKKRLFFAPEKYSKAQLSRAISTSKTTEMSFSEQSIIINYENWSKKHCLDAILSGNIRFSGHSQVGHIVHVNLSPELLPFKSVIGQILLDKVSGCKTVVNKLDIIDSEFRHFKMELLAGIEDYVAEIVEYGCRFRLDFQWVFWNSRLGNEHFRLCAKFENNAMIYDVFAGVGPFVIPAAKTTASTIFANDLNPHAVHYLRENLVLNKVDSVRVFNLDGKRFIREIIGPDLEKKLTVCTEGAQNCLKKCPISSAHVVMNLPALAVTFLPYFFGILNKFNTSSENGLNLSFPLIIHCYLFSKTDACKMPIEHFANDAKKQVLQQLNDEPVKIVDIFHVRNVAPRKEMMCVSFEMPPILLFGNEPQQKRAKY